jgi:hypothetical protein
MSLEQTLKKVQHDIETGELGKARDRLHGLVNTYPDDLSLRKKLGEAYWQLQMPEMAGRYWYLEQEKDERMTRACERFEKQFGDDPAHLLFAIRFRGQMEPIKDTFAGQALLGLQEKAQKKHFWFGDFQKKGRAKYRPYTPPVNKVKYAVGMTALVVILLLLASVMCVGLVTVLNWLL